MLFASTVEQFASISKLSGFVSTPIWTLVGTSHQSIAFSSGPPTLCSSQSSSRYLVMQSLNSVCIFAYLSQARCDCTARRSYGVRPSLLPFAPSHTSRRPEAVALLVAYGVRPSLHPFAPSHTSCRPEAVAPRVAYGVRPSPTRIL